MVDLDSNPTKLIEIVEIGKQLLITRTDACNVCRLASKQESFVFSPTGREREISGVRLLS